MNNNPINFNDPSGHRACDDEDCLEYIKYGTGKNSTPTNTVLPTKKDLFQAKTNQTVDLGDFITSVVGINLGVSHQIGMFAEVGQTVDVDAFFNVKSGQFSLGYTSGPIVYGGTPSLLNGSAYIGGIGIYNLSDNLSLEGYSDYTGGTIAGDAFGKLGYSYSIGKLRDNSNSIIGKPFIDPERGKAVRFTQATVNLGVNAFANGIDGGLIHGFTKTHLWGTWEIPNWGEWK